MKRNFPQNSHQPINNKRNAGNNMAYNRRAYFIFTRLKVRVEYPKCARATVIGIDGAYEFDMPTIIFVERHVNIYIDSLTIEEYNELSDVERMELFAPYYAFSSPDLVYLFYSFWIGFYLESALFCQSSLHKTAALFYPKPPSVAFTLFD